MRSPLDLKHQKVNGFVSFFPGKLGRTLASEAFDGSADQDLLKATVPCSATTPRASPLIRAMRQTVKNTTCSFTMLTPFEPWIGTGAPVWLSLESPARVKLLSGSHREGVSQAHVWHASCSLVCRGGPPKLRTAGLNEE